MGPLGRCTQLYGSKTKPQTEYMESALTAVTIKTFIRDTASGLYKKCEEKTYKTEKVKDKL